MSTLINVGGIAAANLATVLLRRRRAIADIIPNVVLEEIQIDEIQITEHPVETGAPISDHAFRRPSELVMKVGWSNSSPLSVLGIPIPGVSRGLASAVTSFGEKDYVTEAYERLQEILSARETISITTGKRVYRNMLLQSLAVTTDEKTENTLMTVARFREVIIVNSASRTVPPAAEQAAPERTAPTVEQGSAIQREELPPIGAGP